MIFHLLKGIVIICQDTEKRINYYHAYSPVDSELVFYTQQIILFVTWNSVSFQLLCTFTDKVLTCLEDRDMYVSTPLSVKYCTWNMYLILTNFRAYLISRVLFFAIARKIREKVCYISRLCQCFMEQSSKTKELLEMYKGLAQCTCNYK